MKTLTEPFKIKMVESLKYTTESYRKTVLIKAGFNPFLLRSSDVFIDLLTDSGTGAMSDKQWAGMMVGDESYAGARSWERLERTVKELSGMPHVLPTHQGRAAERIAYGLIGGKGKYFVSNTHFDTTRANIEATGAIAIDALCVEGKDNNSEFLFKGNIDIKRLTEVILDFGSSSISGVILTVTNNSSGGQPVSLENILAVRKVCDTFQIPLIIDGCRIAENAYFIKCREQGYTQVSSKAIAQKILAVADIFIMSAKKDGLVNMGGLLALRDEVLATNCKNQLIISEGFTTYGGLSGRDMEALAIGLEEVFDEDYLHYRIASTTYLGKKLKEKGIPVIWPIGGHAVYIDAAKLYNNIPVEQYPGQVLVCDLYVKGGIRAVEVGSLMFGKYDEEGKLVPATKELVRLAIPRRVYTQSHIDYVCDTFDDILEDAEKKTGFKITYEPKMLRHFTAHLEKI